MTAGSAGAYESCPSGPGSLKQNAFIRLASTWAIDQAREVVNTLYHGAGATAIFDDRPFERRFREVEKLAAARGIGSDLDALEGLWQEVKQDKKWSG